MSANQIKTSFERVEFILERYPRTRDCDKKLYFQYLLVYHSEELVGYGSFKEVCQSIINSKTPSPETIRRCRQKIQEQGRWLGEKKVKRLIEAEKVKDWARNE